MNEADVDAAIQEHLKLCEELHELLLEENRLMRVGGNPPDEAFLERKKAYLPRLDASVARLKALNNERVTFSEPQELAVQDARKKLLQLLMLDRENERLLLKTSLPTKMKQAYGPVAPGLVAKAYGNILKS